MPSPSLYGKSVELTNRTLVHRSSPRQTAVAQRVHTGLLYADGTPYRGGKGHCSNIPKDHEVINPPKPDAGYVEPTAFLPGGLPIVLGRRNSMSGSVTPRSSSPAVTQHGTGKRHVSPSTSFRDSPIRQDRVASPADRLHKLPTAGPKDHAITGVFERSENTIDTARSTTPSGRRYLDGCPRFQPPSFDKKPYTPQTRRVPHKIPDNDIFNSNGASSAAESVGTRTPIRSRTPSMVASAAPVTPSSGAIGSVVRASHHVTPARSPAPYAMSPVTAAPTMTPGRSRTPVRAASPGASRYNIITGQAL